MNYTIYPYSIFVYYVLLFDIVLTTVPENVEDETMGTLHFAEQFEKRYGRAHPDFFTGTFDEAIKESCLKPAKEVIQSFIYSIIVLHYIT